MINEKLGAATEKRSRSRRVSTSRQRPHARARIYGLPVDGLKVAPEHAWDATKHYSQRP